MLTVINVDAREVIFDIRVMLNRISTRDFPAEQQKDSKRSSANILSINSNNYNTGLLRAAMPKNITVINPTTGLLTLSIGNEWSFVSFRDLKNWIKSNTPP
jgi:hypothetical protein